MNVVELYQLGEWFSENYPDLQKLHNELSKVLKHNATQQQKLPVEQPLEDLTKYLSEMPIEALSLQQLRLLEKIGVKNYLGVRGARFVENAVKTTSYDPASANANIREVGRKLSQAASDLKQYQTSVDQFGLSESNLEAEKERATIRIVFKSEASMNNVKDWKDHSKNWHDIIRGVAMSVGETPEGVRVVGASNGSIIMILAGTAAVTTLLAVIVKNLTGIAKNVITTKIAWEKYKQTSIVSDTMEREHKKLLKEQREEGLRIAKEAAVAALQRPIEGDAQNALESAVDKMLGFSEKGGELDFIAPPEEYGGDFDAFTETRQAITDLQSERQSVLLLENRVEDDE